MWNRVALKSLSGPVLTRAWVGGLPGVSPLVTHQMLLPREGLVTVCAVVGSLRFNTLVHSVMAVEVLPPTVCLGTALVGAVQYLAAVRATAAPLLLLGPRGWDVVMHDAGNHGARRVRSVRLKQLIFKWENFKILLVIFYCHVNYSMHIFRVCTHTLCAEKAKIGSREGEEFFIQIMNFSVLQKERGRKLFKELVSHLKIRLS